MPAQSAPFPITTVAFEVKVEPAPKVKPPKLRVPVLVMPLVRVMLAFVVTAVEVKLPAAPTVTSPVNVVAAVLSLSMKVPSI